MVSLDGQRDARRSCSKGDGLHVPQPELIRNPFGFEDGPEADIPDDIMARLADAKPQKKASTTKLKAKRGGDYVPTAESVEQALSELTDGNRDNTLRDLQWNLMRRVPRTQWQALK